MIATLIETKTSWWRQLFGTEDDLWECNGARSRWRFSPPLNHIIRMSDWVREDGTTHVHYVDGMVPGGIGMIAMDGAVKAAWMATPAGAAAEKKKVAAKKNGLWDIDDEQK